MNWEGERYVRLYTRDTVNWKLLPWQSKCVIPLVMRKLDRAGMLDLGDAGVDGLAALIDLPVEVVAPGIDGALKGNVFVVADGTLVMPHFLEAQECQQTDAQRQRDLRERRRAEGLVRRQANGADTWVSPDSSTVQVTAGHKVTEQVTEGHNRSPQPCLPVPSRAVPAVEEEESKPSAADAAPVPLQGLWNRLADPHLPRWREAQRKRRREAARAIRERSLEGPGGWEEVIATLNRTPFLLGQNDRGWKASLDWLLKPGIAAKVLEGVYERGTGPPKDVRKGVVRAEDMDHSNQEVGPDGTIHIAF